MPFVFCFDQSLLLLGTPYDIALAVITALLGCVIMGMAIAGWFMKDLALIFRLCLIPCSIALLVSGPNSLLVNAIGLAAAAVVIGLNFATGRDPAKPNAA